MVGRPRKSASAASVTDNGPVGANSGPIGTHGASGDPGATIVIPGDAIDPDAPAPGDATAASGDPAGSGPKRRGRKPGSTNKSKAGASALDINGVEQILLSSHAMLAAMMGAPELLLDAKEANAVAVALNNVARHYDLSATQKTLDWINLAMILGGTYGMRAVMIYNRQRKRGPSPQEGSANGT